MTNYRVVKDSEGWLEIREIEWDNGEIIAISPNAIHPSGESLKELKEDLTALLQCSIMGVIELDDLNISGGSDV